MLVELFNEYCFATTEEAMRLKGMADFFMKMEIFKNISR